MSNSPIFGDRNGTSGYGDIQRVPFSWALFLGIGGLTILVGLALIGGSLLVSRPTQLVAGSLMLLAGAVELSGSYLARRWIGSVAALMNGVLYCGIGVVLFVEHAGNVGGVILAVAGLVFALGCSRLSLAALKSYTHREITLFNGAIALVVAAMIGAAGYGGQTQLVGLLLGLDVIVAGASWVLFAVVLRRLQSSEA